VYIYINVDVLKTVKILSIYKRDNYKWIFTEYNFLILCYISCAVDKYKCSGLLYVADSFERSWYNIC